MYIYKIPANRDEQPEWFRNRCTKFKEEGRFGRNWIWDWNDTYDRKITIRGGSVNLIFEDEADFVWFSLSE